MADGSPDIDGMVNDPQFLGLSPADKRAALYHLTGDATFNGLSDADTTQFVSRIARPTVPRPVPEGLQGQSLDQRFPITPQPGETFDQTMQNAATAGKTVTPEELQGQAIQGAKMAPAVLAAAPVIGATGAAALAGPGEVPGAIGQAATRALPYVKGIGAWAEANPVAARALIEAVKASGYLLGGYAAMKKALARRKTEIKEVLDKLDE